MWNGVAKLYSPFQQVKNCWCRCLNFLFIYRRRNGCNCLNHYYHYGIIWLELISFKNHINIDENNHVANADIEVEVFINSHIVNNTLIMKWFILICNVEPVNIRKIYNGIHRVCQIEFTLKSRNEGHDS